MIPRSEPTLHNLKKKLDRGTQDVDDADLRDLIACRLPIIHSIPRARTEPYARLHGLISVGGLYGMPRVARLYWQRKPVYQQGTEVRLCGAVVFFSLIDAFKITHD